MDRLAQSLQEVDWQGTGLVVLVDFNDCLNYVGLFLSELELTTLQKAFAPNPNSVDPNARIPVSGFMGLLDIPLSNRRAALVSKVWDSLGGGEALGMDFLTSRMNAAAHPLVRQGTLEADAVMANFADSFGSSDSVSREDFVAYYRNKSACQPQDAYFVDCLESLWSVQEVSERVNKVRLQSIGRTLVEKVRQKMKPGKNVASTLKQTMLFHSKNDSVELDQVEVAAASAHFGVPMTAADTADIFLLYGNGAGKVEATTLSQELHSGAFFDRVASA